MGLFAAMMLPVLAALAGPPAPVISPVAAQPTYYGKWSVSDGGDYIGAHTVNDSGSVFGFLCGKLCVLSTNFQKGCNNGQSYPAMINSESGAISLDLHCYHKGNLNVLTFQLDDNLINMVGRGGEVGFAVPLLGGQFSVSRFSLTGAFQAMEKASQLAAQKADRSQEGLRDFSI